jgi:hypothetical protein
MNVITENDEKRKHSANDAPQKMVFVYEMQSKHIKSFTQYRLLLMLMQSMSVAD